MSGNESQAAVTCPYCGFDGHYVILPERDDMNWDDHWELAGMAVDDDGVACGQCSRFFRAFSNESIRVRGISKATPRGKKALQVIVVEDNDFRDWFRGLRYEKNDIRYIQHNYASTLFLKNFKPFLFMSTTPPPTLLSASQEENHTDTLAYFF